MAYLLGGPLSSISDFSDRPLHAGARWLGNASVKGLRRIFMVNYSFTAQQPVVRRDILGTFACFPPAERVFTSAVLQMYSSIPIHLLQGFLNATDNKQLNA